jgi:hypothetical protein
LSSYGKRKNLKYKFVLSNYNGTPEKLNNDVQFSIRNNAKKRIKLHNGEWYFITNMKGQVHLRGIIFDMDGTLGDTILSIYSPWEHSCFVKGRSRVSHPPAAFYNEIHAPTKSRFFQSIGEGYRTVWNVGQ